MHNEETSHRDLAMSLLTPEQQDFIMNTLRRGKRTAWLNIMAEMKGIVISPEDDEDTIAQKIGGWILERFDDLGVREGKCECGQPLRYVYHVTHIETKDTLSLGSTCIKTYTGLDAKTVDAVIKGMKVFDLEKEEILKKVINGWQLPFTIPPGVEIPVDIQQHLDYQLPLLDRQIARLKRIILKFQHEQHQQADLTPLSKSRQARKGSETPASAFDLFSAAGETAAGMEVVTSPVSGKEHRREIPNLYVIPDAWKAVIHDKLQQLREKGETHVTSLMMANHVARVFGYEHDRYLTGKPRTYFLVASYMDRLSSLDVLNASLENITYRIK